MTAVAEQAATLPVIPDADGQLLKEATLDAGHTVTEWNRTPEQRGLINSYLEMIDRQYTQRGADPRLVALLTDTEPVGTHEASRMLGYEDTTRSYQLYTKRRRLEAVDQVPHPSALPEMDATGGMRGPRVVRGVARGRMIHWILQSCRGRWDPIAGAVVPQTGINAGGAPKKGLKKRG
jgi:hypothetical protein